MSQSIITGHRRPHVDRGNRRSPAPGRAPPPKRATEAGLGSARRHGSPHRRGRQGVSARPRHRIRRRRAVSDRVFPRVSSRSTPVRIRMLYRGTGISYS